MTFRIRGWGSLLCRSYSVVWGRLMAERRPRDGRKKMEKLKMKCYISYKF